MNANFSKTCNKDNLIEKMHKINGFEALIQEIF